MSLFRRRRRIYEDDSSCSSDDEEEIWSDDDSSEDDDRRVVVQQPQRGTGAHVRQQQQPPPLSTGHPSAAQLQSMGQPFQTGMGPMMAERVSKEELPLAHDGSRAQYGYLTPDYPTDNDKPRPMADLPVWQTPILPFTKSKDMSPYDVNRSPFQLFSNQGFDRDSYRPKREIAPMFAPQPQLITGMPNQSQVVRDRYQPSNNLQHQKPFEPEWSIRRNGFHPTTRILPTHVPVYRQQLPHLPVRNADSAFGQVRGDIGAVEVRKFDTSYYYKTPFPNSAPVDAAPNYARTPAKATTRPCINREYGGVAYTGSTEAYVPRRFIMPEQKLPSQMHERLQQGAPGADVNASTAHFMDRARPTIGEGTEQRVVTTNVRAPIPAARVALMDRARPTIGEGTEQSVVVTNAQVGVHGPRTALMDVARPTMAEFTESKVVAGNVRAPIPSGQVGLMDGARPTMAEFTEQAVHAGNMQAPGGTGAPRAALMDVARPTVGEGTESRIVVTNPQGQGFAPQSYYVDPARPTTKQWTSNHEWGGSAQTVGPGAPMSTTNVRDNMTMDDRKEQTQWSRPNGAGNQNVTSTNQDRIGYGDPATHRLVDDNNRWAHIGMRTETNRTMPRWVPQVQVSDRKERTECRSDSRIEPWLLDAFRDNPYTQPLNVW